MLWFYTKKQVDAKIESLSLSDWNLRQDFGKNYDAIQKIGLNSMERDNDLNNQLKVVMEAQKELSQKCEVLKENVCYIKGQLAGKGKK